MVRDDLGDGTIYTDLHELLTHLRECLVDIEEKVSALDTRATKEEDEGDDADGA